MLAVVPLVGTLLSSKLSSKPHPELCISPGMLHLVLLLLIIIPSSFDSATSGASVSTPEILELPSLFSWKGSFVQIYKVKLKEKFSASQNECKRNNYQKYSGKHEEGQVNCNQCFLYRICILVLLDYNIHPYP